MVFPEVVEQTDVKKIGDIWIMSKLKLRQIYTLT